MKVSKLLSQLVGDQKGATAVEYGLIVALVVIGSMVALQGVANENTGLWATVSDRITEVMG